MKSQSSKELLIEKFRKKPDAFAYVMCGIKPTEYQKEILYDNSRRIAVVCSRQVGKSTIIAVKALWSAWCYPKQEILIIAPTFRQAEIVYSKIYEWVVANPILRRDCIKLTMNKLMFENGSIIRCLPAGHTGEGIRGYSATMVIVDEAQSVPDEVFVSIIPAVIVKKGQLILLGTPSHGKQGFLWTAWCSPEFSKHRVTAYDSPFITKEEIDKFRQLKGEVAFRRELLAEFYEADDLFFDMELVRKCAVLTRKTEPQEGWTYTMGIDWSRYGCFDEETEILTDKGWKKFKELNGTELVLTMNPETKEAEYRPIAQIHRYWYEGELYVVESRQHSLAVTPNHKMLRYTRAKERPVFEEIKDLKKSGYLVRDFKWKGEDVGEKMVFEEMEVTIGNGGKLRYDKIEFSMRDWFEFLGWFLAEGNISLFERHYGKRIKKNYKILLSQRNKSGVKKISELLKRMGIVATYKKSGQFEITNKRIWMWLRDNCYIDPDKECEICGRKWCAHKKKVPEIVKRAKPELIRVFLDAYIEGDGYLKKNGSKGYVTTSKQLADDLQELVFKAGGIATLHVRNVKGSRTIIEGREVVRRVDIYTVYEFVDKRKIETAQILKRLKKKYYRGYVYCVTVEPWHTIFVRRNGKCLWTGNSDMNAIVVVGQHEDFEHYEMHNYWVRAKRPISDIIGWAIQKIQLWKPTVVVCDATSGWGSAVDMLREKVEELGLDVSVQDFNFAKKKLRDQLFWNLRRLIEDGKLLILKDERLISQFESYRVKYSSVGHEQIKKEGKHEDITDALAMACWGMTRVIGNRVLPADFIDVDKLLNRGAYAGMFGGWKL